MPALGAIPPGDPQEKGLLFRNARYVCAEVVASAKVRRRRVIPTVPSILAATLMVAPDPVLVDGSIESMLDVGAETWELLCNAGVLKREDWTEDDKWTAIGMMWEFRCRQIAAIRVVMADAPRKVLREKCASTYGKIRVIRERGRRLLKLLSEELRLDYGLPPPEPRTKVEVENHER